MTELLQIGGITDRMKDRLSAAFDIRRLDDFDAARITHVVTNGHDGVPPDLMAQLTNLKMISVYGVGYDAVDATAAAARGVVVTHTHRMCLTTRSQPPPFCLCWPATESLCATMNTSDRDDGK